MTKPTFLKARSVTYYSQRDEGVFFDWLKNIPCVQKCKGEGAELYIHLKFQPSEQELRELIALFIRYRIDLAQFTAFETPQNRHWLRPLITLD